MTYIPTRETPSTRRHLHPAGLGGVFLAAWAAYTIVVAIALFAKYNLNPEIVLIVGGTQSMQALLSNYAHFALASATPALSVGLQGETW